MLLIQKEYCKAVMHKALMQFVDDVLSAFIWIHPPSVVQWLRTLSSPPKWPIKTLCLKNFTMLHTYIHTCMNSSRSQLLFPYTFIYNRTYVLIKFSCTLGLCSPRLLFSQLDVTIIMWTIHLEKPGLSLVPGVYACQCDSDSESWLIWSKFLYMVYQDDLHSQMMMTVWKPRMAYLFF